MGRTGDAPSGRDPARGDAVTGRSVSGTMENDPVRVARRESVCNAPETSIGIAGFVVKGW